MNLISFLSFSQHPADLLLLVIAPEKSLQILFFVVELTPATVCPRFSLIAGERLPASWVGKHPPRGTRTLRILSSLDFHHCNCGICCQRPE